MRASCSLAVLALAGLAAAPFVQAGCRLDRGSSSDDGGTAPDVDVDAPAGQGMLAVQARQCGQCHQSPNPADGVLSGQTTPVRGTHAYGSNLTPDPDTGMDAWDAGSIAQAILLSQRLDGGALCPAMPAYADAGMGTGEALAIAAYLQSLVAVWHPIPASTCTPP
jgi:mono/diheme cytochrome c family protein